MVTVRGGGHSEVSANVYRAHGRMTQSGAMTVVSELLAAVGTLAAVVLILLMAVVPFLLDLPLSGSEWPRPKNR